MCFVYGFHFNYEENVARRKWKSPLLVYASELLKFQRNGQFPDEPVRIKV
jgi:hypothetical protein